MGYFAELDVSLEETVFCVVDDADQIVHEARAGSTFCPDGAKASVLLDKCGAQAKGL